MTEMTEEQTRLVIRLGEMLVADNWRGIAAHEGAALALAQDLRVADPEVAGFILSALGNAHGRLGDFSQAIAYLPHTAPVDCEGGGRPCGGGQGVREPRERPRFDGGLFPGDRVLHAVPDNCQGAGRLDGGTFMFVAAI